MRYAVILLASIVLVLGSQALGRADAPAGVPRWEYRLVSVVGGPEFAPIQKAMPVETAMLLEMLKKSGHELVDEGEFRKFLTDAGAAGWDLFKHEERFWIFKRPLK